MRRCARRPHQLSQHAAENRDPERNMQGQPVQIARRKLDHFCQQQSCTGERNPVRKIRPHSQIDCQHQLRNSQEHQELGGALMQEERSRISSQKPSGEYRLQQHRCHIHDQNSAIDF